MPGLFGCVIATADATHLERVGVCMGVLIDAQRPPGRFVWEFRISPPVLLGYHGLVHRPWQNGIACSETLTVVAEGVLLDPAVPLSPAELLARYQRDGLSLVERLRGHFALAVYDATTGDLCLYTDPAATCPIYYAAHKGAFYFASDWHALTAVFSSPEDINPQAVADMLTFGYMVGDKTPWKAIRCMQAGGCLRWNVHSACLDAKRYFVADNTPLVSASYVAMREELRHLFVQAVERFLCLPQPLFTLSGGMDSRAILSTALQLGYDHPDCLIFGDLASLDVRLARRVADASGANAVVVGLGSGDYLVDTMTAATRYNGSMVDYSGSAHLLHALQQLDPFRWYVVHTGLSGDMLMGSFLKAAEIGEPVFDEQTACDRIIAHLGKLGWADQLAADPQDARRLVFASLRASLEGKLQPGMSMSQVLELWNLHNRQQRGMFNGFRVIENFAAYTSPFFDADLYQYTLRIPHRYRVGEAIYVDMLSRLLRPDLWRIPWQKTGWPPSRLPWVNKVNAWSTLWIGRAGQFMFPAVAHQRSMNPMGAWLQENVRLRRFAVEQLLSWSRIPEPLSPDKVSHFAQKVAAGQIGRYTPTLLFYLLTLRTWGQNNAS